MGAGSHLATTHDWSEQEVQIDGCTFFHRQCQVCLRDFARSSRDEEWRAVHVGVLKFDFLEDEITRRWVSEDCPGHPQPGEGNEERIRHFKGGASA